VTWIAPDVERAEGYPARRNDPEREMLRDWLDWLDWLGWLLSRTRVNGYVPEP
jgi:hypothetical protein